MKIAFTVMCKGEEKYFMKDKSFVQISRQLLDKEVEVITIQGSFEGILVEVGSDVIVLERRRGQRPLRVIIRIEAIVALHRLEIMPRGPFNFGFHDANVESPESGMNEF